MFGVALVVADEHVVGVVLEVVLDVGAHLIAGREVERCAGACVHGQHVEVFVAAEVLGKQRHVVALEYVAREIAFGLVRELARLADEFFAIQRLHEQVHAACFARGLHEAQRLAVFAQAVVAALGVLEEVADRVGLGRGLRGHLGLSLSGGNGPLQTA